MQVSVEELSDIERQLTIVVEGSQLEDAYNQRMEKVARTARISGFRPGKVPLREVKRRYGTTIRMEVVGEIVQQAYRDACIETTLNPLGQPSFELPQSLEPAGDEPFSFKATIEVYPEVTIQPFNDIRVIDPSVEVTDADVQTVIDRMREQKADYQLVERVAAEGDRVVIDFAGTKDGEAFEGGTAEDFNLELGSKSMIPGFEEGIVGMGKDDRKTIQVSFPDDYHETSLAGQPVEFEITVKTVEEKVLPELDQEFLESIGASTDTDEPFEAQVRTNMERELKAAKDNYVKAQVASGLVDTHDFSVPKILIQQEVDELKMRFFERIGMGKPNQEQLDSLPGAMFEDRAMDRVKAGIVFHALYKAESIEVPEERLRAEIERMAEPYDEPEKVIDWYYANESNLEQVKNVVLEAMLAERVMQDCQVEALTCSYDEAIERFRDYEQERQQELASRKEVDAPDGGAEGSDAPTFSATVVNSEDLNQDK